MQTPLAIWSRTSGQHRDRCCRVSSPVCLMRLAQAILAVQVRLRLSPGVRRASRAAPRKRTASSEIMGLGQMPDSPVAINRGTGRAAVGPCAPLLPAMAQALIMHPHTQCCRWAICAPALCRVLHHMTHAVGTLPHKQKCRYQEHSASLLPQVNTLDGAHRNVHIICGPSSLPVSTETHNAGTSEYRPFFWLDTAGVIEF